jgi:5-methylcytosine-specific restriction endonuclease McrA
MTSPSQRSRSGGRRACGRDIQRKRRRLIQEQGGLCHWCGAAMRDDVAEQHPQRATLDHVVALADGGTNRNENLVAACRACNERRSSRSARRHNSRRGQP